MKFIKVEYDHQKVIVEGSNEKKDFISKIDAKNVVYIFMSNTTCNYIGESKVGLKYRCFTHTTKHIEQEFFIKSNEIYIMVLEDVVDNRHRKLIEASLIATCNPKYNSN